MGWWPSFLGGTKSSDPFTSLDPNLREFLEKESPVKYNNQQGANPAEKAAQQPSPSSKSQRQNASSAIAETAQSPAGVPAESLYQDGRYAHLWKGYRPQAEIEEANATEHDKMMSVLEGYNARKTAIGRAALENCAIQQEDWVNCMKSGSWEGRLTMCKDQVRKYERCYTMQHVGFFFLFFPYSFTMPSTHYILLHLRISTRNDEQTELTLWRLSTSDFYEPSDTRPSTAVQPQWKKISRCTRTLCTNAC